MTAIEKLRRGIPLDLRRIPPLLTFKVVSERIFFEGGGRTGHAFEIIQIYFKGIYFKTSVLIFDEDLDERVYEGIITTFKYIEKEYSTPKDVVSKIDFYGERKGVLELVSIEDFLYEEDFGITVCGDEWTASLTNIDEQNIMREKVQERYDIAYQEVLHTPENKYPKKPFQVATVDCLSEEPLI